MRLIVPVIIIIVFILFVDLYLFKALWLFCRNSKNKNRIKLIYIFHWLIPFTSMILFFVINRRVSQVRDPKNYTFIFYAFGFFALIYFPKFIFLIFYLIEDLVFLVCKIVKSRIQRISLISKIGFFISLIPFFLLIYGNIWGKTDFKIRKAKLAFENLPSSFNNLKIVQLSDVHLGSFAGDTAVVGRIVDIVNAQNPDVLFFTGDFVNNFSEEFNGMESTLLRLKSKYGKFSILGNHDYGDYYKWKSEIDKSENLKRIKDIEKKFGFKLLLNEYDSLTVNGQSIAIIGVENWGKPPFKQYGNIDKAKTGTDNFAFKILLSHDPDYWRTAIVNKTNIDLTLSGHTHGMQLGFEIGGKRWSTAKWKFPEWGGLYRDGKQFLYVNVGAGFIGIPVRIGMPPEITVIELQKGRTYVSKNNSQSAIKP